MAKTDKSTRIRLEGIIKTALSKKDIFLADFPKIAKRKKNPGRIKMKGKTRISFIMDKIMDYDFSIRLEETAALQHRKKRSGTNIPNFPPPSR
jgi:hypothetical protein